MPSFIIDGREPAEAAAIRSRLNSGTATERRPQFNFIEGTNMTITVTDDAGSDEVDITITSNTLSSTTPVANDQTAGTAGVATKAARGDHRHPRSGAQWAYNSSGTGSSLTVTTGFQPRFLASYILLTSLNNNGWATGTGNQQWSTDGASVTSIVGRLANSSGVVSTYAVTTFNTTQVVITRTTGAENFSSATCVVFGEN